MKSKQVKDLLQEISDWSANRARNSGDHALFVTRLDQLLAAVVRDDMAQPTDNSVKHAILMAALEGVNALPGHNRTAFSAELQRRLLELEGKKK